MRYISGTANSPYTISTTCATMQILWEIEYRDTNFDIDLDVRKSTAHFNGAISWMNKKKIMHRTNQYGC